MNEPMPAAPEPVPAAAGTEPTETITQPVQTEGPTVLPIKFKGIGSEYFGIWIVNLLLLMVTFGLYYPWARVRKLVYFAQSTEVGGYPLSFHGKAKQMFVPFIVAVLGFIAYTIAESAVPILAFAILALFALAWPWLFKAANRFRLGKTEWRGLRLGFLGTTGGAYKAILIPIAVGMAMYSVSIWLGTANPDFEGLDDAETKSTLKTIGLVIGGFFLVNLALFPLFTFFIKRYQHNNFAYASLKTHFSARLRDFYWLFAKTLCVAALSLLVFASPLLILYFGFIDFPTELFSSDIEKNLEENPGEALGLVMAFMIFFILAFVFARFYFVVVSTFWQTGLFNLLWPNTKANQTRFVSNLSFRKFLGITVLNAILVTLTMGIYLPFAQLAIARVKLHALHIESDADIDSVIADVRSGKTSAAADIAADVLDIDIGI